MSYRELRNFCEIMRSLGFPRLISMENFRVPNFKLAAEIIFWLVTRFDPKAEISTNIEDERARVEFVKSACIFFYTNCKIKLNPKKVYASDGHCVQELLKVADILYKAKRSVAMQNDYEFGQELDISSRKNEIEQIKNLSEDIVNLGINLLDLLDKEKVLKASRESAIEYLENLSKNYENTKNGEIEKKIMSILSGQEKVLEQLDTHVNELKQKENELNQDLQVKRVEYERAEKRLESLQHAQPAHLTELGQYENELSIIYRIYVEKIRNHDYLQSRVAKYQKMEEANKKKLKGQFEELTKKVNQQYKEDNEIDVGQDEEEDDGNRQIIPQGELEGDEEGENFYDDDDDHF